MARSREYLLDDDDWEEVGYINSYAVFMAYLSMAIKGLGFLILTWTTVVLLGGFVSVLHKKDFWCLTFITLVQTAGIFDVVLNEKLGYVTNSAMGLMVGVFSGVVGEQVPLQAAPVPKFLAFVLLAVQIMVLGALLFPLAVIYMLGILISGGISLWRLIEHDYSDGEASNLGPAMDTLYYIALLQGVLFCYRFINARSWRGLAKRVATPKVDRGALEIVSNYLHETRKGCEKDPSFAKGRNFITHAVDMIGSKSPIDSISGVKILYTAIYIENVKLKELEGEKESEKYRDQQDIIIGQHMLMKHLVVSASSSTHILKKLLETLDSRGVHDRDTRHQAAMIVEHLAFSINLEEFPQGIQHISSLIETFEQYGIAEPYHQDCLYDEYEQHWKLKARCQLPSPSDVVEKAYKDLLLKGLSILRKLAAQENNCRVMSDTRGLVSKVMAPITSDLLHHTIDDHAAWSDIVEKSMELVSQLTSAPGETGARLRHDISRCKEAISTLWRILSCNECNEELQQRAIQILTRLYMHTTEGSKAADSALREESCSREDFVSMLLDIFTSGTKYSSSIRGCAGGALSEISSRGGISHAFIAVQKTSDVVDGITEVLVHDKSKICRQAAAELLTNLCTHGMDSLSPSSHVLPSSPAAVPSVCVSTTPIPPSILPSPHPKVKDLGKLKKAILKVLGEMLHYGDRTLEGKEVEQERFAKPKTDIESQFDNGQGNRISSSTSNHPQNNEQGEEENESVTSATLLSSLLSLFATVYDPTSIGDLSPRLDASSFLSMLKEVVVKKSEHPTVENLLLFKAIAKMVIVMMKQSGSMSIKQEDFQSLLEALSEAWRKIMNLDYSMIFSSFDSSSATTASKLDRCTLASLLKEAKDLLARAPSTSASS